MSFGPALANFIRAVIGPLDYYAQHPARVLAQNSNGTLELQPDSARVPALSAVPIRGLPGVTVKVAPGARVLVGFEGGNPSAPIATLWEASGLMEVTVTSTVKVTVSSPLVVLADGTLPVARQTDAVTVTGTAGPYPLVVTAAFISGGNPKVLG